MRVGIEGNELKTTLAQSKEDKKSVNSDAMIPFSQEFGKFKSEASDAHSHG